MAMSLVRVTAAGRRVSEAENFKSHYKHMVNADPRSGGSISGGSHSSSFSTVSTASVAVSSSVAVTASKVMWKVVIVSGGRS